MKHLVSIMLLTVLALTGGCVTEKDRPAYSLQKGDSVPHFEVVMNNGQLFSTPMLAKKTSVIAFFNTGCSDCRRELPEIQKAYETCLKEGLSVIFACIAREEDAASIAVYWEQNGLSLPYSAQTDREVYSLFASGGIPRIYVATPFADGAVVAAAYTDTKAPDAESLLALLRQLETLRNIKKQGKGTTYLKRM